jgi:hypothetical protein
MAYCSRRVIGLITLVLLSTVSWSQVSFHSLNNDYYHVLDRYTITRTDSQFCTSIKPFNRESTFQYRAQNQLVSSADRFNFELISVDNWDVLPVIDPGYYVIQKRPAWNIFYRKPASLFSVDREDFQLVVNPALGFEGGQENGTSFYRNTRGVELRGSIDNKVGFYSFISENQFRYPSFYSDEIEAKGVIPGAGFIKPFGANGYDFFVARGYLTFKATKHINVQFGHDNNFIGNGYRSLILSDFAKENLSLKFHTSIWRFNYMNLFSELTDYQDRSISGTRKKYAAFHYLNINVLPGKLNIGLFENIVFARNDSNQQQGYEVNYLNPIIFYRAVEHGLNSSDNSIVGMDWKWNFLNKFSFYGQFVLDEFHKNELFNRTGSWVNKWAFQSGLKWINAANIRNLDVQVELNRVRPYVYTHFKTDQTWSHHDQSMAHPLGANFKEAVSIIRYQPIKRLNLVAKVISAIHGADSTYDANTTHFGGNVLATYDNRPKDTGISIGDGLQRDISILSLRASYMLYYRTWLDLRVIHRVEKSDDPLPDYNSTLFMIGLRMNLAPQQYDY